MALSKEEVLADLRKARVRKFVYFGAGIGLFLLSTALLVMFFIKRRDWGALALSVVGFIWGAVLLNQSMRARGEEDQAAARLEELEEADPPADSTDHGDPVGEPPWLEPDEDSVERSEPGEP